MCFLKMQTDFGLFQERLESACSVRHMTVETLYNSTGISSYDAHMLPVLGLKTLGIFELTQIAGTLDVSVDWLLGRTDQMELPKPSSDDANQSSAGFERGN
jgi:hypothetical protein